MRKQEYYRIIIDGVEVFDALGHGEYGDIMEDLALEFYQTGSPHPDRIKTEIYSEVIDG
tara:strand:- start:148 stop:324 length:177 start_codon:yes stop_codon:yes gene_type:complete